jgi:hypothetical protein
LNQKSRLCTRGRCARAGPRWIYWGFGGWARRRLCWLAPSYETITLSTSSDASDPFDPFNGHLNARLCPLRPPPSVQGRGTGSAQGRHETNPSPWQKHTHPPCPY